MSTAADAARATDELASSLAARGAAEARVAFVLGSGLGAFADRLEDARAFAFEDLDGMPRAAVAGHAGRVVLGTLDGVPVLAQQGRVHLYEGATAEVVTRSVRAYARLGCRALVLTNAAGGLVREWPVPCLMRIEDHLNMQGRTPLTRGQAGIGTPYDEAAGAALDAAAREARVGLRRGVYVGLLGPTYESPAEIRHLARLGAHAVGMSTVCEAQAGAAAGMAVAAVSCISNPGAGLADGPLNHAEVVEAGRQIADDFCRLLVRAVPRLSRVHHPEES